MTSRRLGGELGLTLVLHTWARDLSYHPHVHAIVTGGALTSDDRWRPAHPEYLFPVEVLGRLFRGKLLAALARQSGAGHQGDPSWDSCATRWTRT